MAKRDFYRNGRFTTETIRKIAWQIDITESEKKMQKPRVKIKGIREIVLEVYHAQGILEAYKTLEEYNKRFDKPVYTREMFESWIAEENRRSKGKKIDDGFDR